MHTWDVVSVSRMYIEIRLIWVMNVHGPKAGRVGKHIGMTNYIYIVAYDPSARNLYHLYYAFML